MINELIGLPFAPGDLDALAQFSSRAAERGMATDIGPLCDDVPEAMFVSPSDGADASFVIWRDASARYWLSDLRNLADGAVETLCDTLAAALDGVFNAVSAAGRVGVVAPPAIGAFGLA